MELKQFLSNWHLSPIIKGKAMQSNQMPLADKLNDLTNTTSSFSGNNLMYCNDHHELSKCIYFLYKISSIEIQFM